MKNIDFYEKELKKTNLIKWLSVIISITILIIEFILSINGIDILTIFGCIISIIAIIGIILFFLKRKKEISLKNYIYDLNKITEAIEDSKN